MCFICYIYIVGCVIKYTMSKFCKIEIFTFIQRLCGEPSFAKKILFENWQIACKSLLKVGIFYDDEKDNLIFLIK